MTYPDTSKISSIYRSLTLEKNELNDSLSYTTQSAGISSANANTYKIPAAALDKIILQKVELINTKKQQIVSLLTDNYDKLIVNCGIASKDPGISSISNGSFVPASGIKSDACLIESSTVGISSTIIISGTLKTFQYNCQIFINGSGGVGIGTTQQCDTGVRGEVRKDALYAWNFPALENYDTTVIMPQQNPTYTGVTTSNIGIGKTSLFFNDKNDPIGFMTTSTLIGYYYPIVGTGSTCTALLNQVQTLENQIVSIRTEINQLIPSINVLKEKKIEEQLTAYYENQGYTDTQSRVSGITSVINVLDQYKTEIISYENSLTSTNNYRNKTGNYTYDPT